MFIPNHLNIHKYVVEMDTYETCSLDQSETIVGVRNTCWSQELLWKTGTLGERQNTWRGRGNLWKSPTCSRGGTNSSIFLNIGETLYPQVFLGVVLCIKNEIIFLKFQNWIFTPPTRGQTVFLVKKKIVGWFVMTKGTWNHPGQKKFGLVTPLNL